MDEKKFNEKEIALTNEVFWGRARWLAGHYGQFASKQIVEEIEKLRRKVIAYMKND